MPELPELPDLDRDLAALRDRLTDSVRLPPIAEVAERARQRASRRRVLVGAALAVAAVLAVVPALRTPPPDPEPDAAVAPVVGSPSVSYQVEAADARHFYAVRTRCGGVPGSTCQADLRVTEDGTTWDTRQLPVHEEMAPDGFSARLSPLGMGRLVVDGLSTTTLDRRWYSPDDGRTWHEVPAGTAGTTPAIPAGAVLEARCVNEDQQIEQSCLRHVVATMPDSGERRALAVQPPLDWVWPQAIPVGDGGWWVSGKLPGTSVWALAVTHDQGLTWTASPLPEWRGYPFVDITVSGWGSTLYTVAQGDRSLESTGLLAIFRSTDGGATWQQTWNGVPGVSPRAVYRSLVVSPEGDLVAVSPDQHRLLSTDGGVTWRPADDQPPDLGWVRWTKAGYLATGEGETYLLSRDGRDWQSHRVG